MPTNKWQYERLAIQGLAYIYDIITSSYLFCPTAYDPNSLLC